MRFVLLDQLKKFTPRYKEIFGYECCINIKQLQLTLNSWRRKQIKIPTTRLSCEYCSIILPNDKYLHNRPDDAMKNIRCPLAEGTVLTKLKCFLRMCDSLSLYNVVITKVPSLLKALKLIVIRI